MRSVFLAFVLSCFLASAQSVFPPSGGGGTPSGAAGGDLSGTYPNPGVAQVNGKATVVFSDQANTFSAGSKQSVQSNGTNAGFNFGGVTADPATQVLGDLWFRSDLSQLSFFNGQTQKRFATIDQIPAVTAAGYAPNQTLGGCGVAYTSGLSFTVGACSYTINGATYSSPITNETLSAADPTNDRIDVIGVDATGAVFVITGTPAVSPQQPTIDPTTQLQLTFVYVAANATTPSNVVTDNLYDEGTEWTLTTTTHIVNSTNNPYHLTHDLEATAAVLGNNATLVKPAAGTVDLATRNTLVFYIRSKAAWPIGASGATAARFLSLWWQNGATQKGNQVVLRDGQFGFSSSNTTAYQQINIPTSLFGINGIPVTTLKIQVSGPSGSSSIGWYLDWVTLQGGTSAPALPSTLMNFQNAWSSATAYNPNDLVVSGGIGYVALAANTNVAVSTAATWAPLAAAAPTVVHSFGAIFNGGGTALVAPLTSYITVPYACTIQAWNITATPAGSATVDIWKIATGTAVPTVTNTITASAVPAISTGTAIHSTTRTGWTTSVAQNDYVAFNLSAAATSTQVTITVQCQ